MTTDPFAEQEKNPSVSFKDAPIGTTYTGEVVEAPSFAQSRDYDTSEPLYWQQGGKQSTQPSDQPVMSIVTVLEINGERRSLWASKWAKPGSMFSAIQEAQKAAGSQIAVGGRLTVTLVGVEPSDNPKFNDRKLYKAQYVPPNPFAGAPDWAQPNPQTGEVPMQQPAQQPQSAYAQTAPQQPSFTTTPAGYPAPPAQQPAPQSSAPTFDAATIEAIKAAGMDPAAVIAAALAKQQG